MAAQGLLQTLKRVDGWEQRLFDYVKERWAMPFTWGTNDCLMFAAGAIQTIAGQDLAKQFPTYDSEFGAGRILVEYGSVEGLITHMLGGPVDWKMAQRGDVVLLEMNQTGPAAGICVGLMAYGPGLNGIEIIPMNQATKAWRV